MNSADKNLKQSALAMKFIAWVTILVFILGPFIYPAGLLWGSHPPGFPHIGSPHPESPYHAFHPYVFMIFALYLAWAILLLRGARDPKAAASLFDWGFLANLLHGLLMAVQAFIYPGEIAHLWADALPVLALSAACWYWHPNRVISDAVEK